MLHAYMHMNSIHVGVYMYSMRTCVSDYVYMYVLVSRELICRSLLRADVPDDHDLVESSREQDSPLIVVAQGANTACVCVCVCACECVRVCACVCMYVSMRVSIHGFVQMWHVALASVCTVSIYTYMYIDV